MHQSNRKTVNQVLPDRYDSYEFSPLIKELLI